MSGIDTTAWSWWPFWPFLVTRLSLKSGCSGLLGFCSSPHLYLLLCLLENYSFPSPASSPDLKVCCAGTGQCSELLCLHYKHRNLHSCSSPHPLPDLMPTGFSQVFWHLTMKTSSASPPSLLKLDVVSPHLDFHCRVLLTEVVGLFHT